MSIPISAIVPSSNRASYIGETIESIFIQTLPPAEVVIVDDGSTDEEGFALSGFGEKVASIASKTRARALLGTLASVSLLQP